MVEGARLESVFCALNLAAIIAAPSSPAPATFQLRRPKAAPRKTSMKLGCGSGPRAVRTIVSHTGPLPRPLLCRYEPLQFFDPVEHGDDLVAGHSDPLEQQEPTIRCDVVWCIPTMPNILSGRRRTRCFEVEP